MPMGESLMKSNDNMLFFLFGVVFWIVGTLAYRMRGTFVFESGSVRYWVNFVVIPIVSTAICIVLLKARHIPAHKWAEASLLIALPGMFGEAAILSSFTTFMPRMHAESGGKYGAFLFASYALLLTVAEIVTLKA